MNYPSLLADSISQTLGGSLTAEQIIPLIETPKQAQHGDFAFPCFTLAKQQRQAPAAIAARIAAELQSPIIEKAEAVGPYVNVFLKREAVSAAVIAKVLNEKDAYGAHTFGTGKTVVMDYSSPNIAKPFSMGHLRSTMIGNSLKRILQKCGYEVVGINYIGDWGTQFGKLMAAYTKWGSEADVKQQPIQELFRLYVRFHEEAKTDPALEEEGRAWFKKLEDGDETATALWTWFRAESLQEFSRIYDLLGVSFDSYNGEAFYNDKMAAAVQLLEEKGLLAESEGAQVVDLTEEGMPPCLVRKSDGATLYATRDLAAALYRQETYGFERALYVVGQEQSLHFNQLFAVLRKLGYDWVNGMSHVPFGLILQDGKKMSTRKGKVVLLHEVLEEAIALAERNIELKNPSLANKDEVAKAVGVGAVIFHDLKNERIHNIEFSLETMLKFEGETGPYVQYTHARACSLLRKAGFTPGISPVALGDEASWQVVKQLQAFPKAVEQAFGKYEPSQISKYVLDLAQAFNKYYGAVRVLEEDGEKESRLALVYAVTLVLAEGLRLLGVAAPQEM